MGKSFRKSHFGRFAAFDGVFADELAEQLVEGRAKDFAGSRVSRDVAAFLVSDQQADARPEQGLGNELRLDLGISERLRH